MRWIISGTQVSGMGLRVRRGRWLVGALVWAGAVNTVAAQVTVEGGSEPQKPSTYSWTVTNRGNQPVVSFEFPHFRVLGANPPEGWIFEEIRLDAPGHKGSQRMDRFSTTEPRALIRKGQSRTFSILTNARKAVVSQGPAIITFEDGTTLTVTDIEIPWGESWLRKRALLLMMGAIFALFIVVQIVRGIRKRPSAQVGGGVADA
ncbi:MAG: hypothetical protein GY842_12980 [bacterium]|nr:hypothetical protein [bacterium]